MALQLWHSWAPQRTGSPQWSNNRPGHIHRIPGQSGSHHSGLSGRNTKLPEVDKRVHPRHIPEWKAKVALELSEGRVEAVVADVSKMGMGLLVDVNRADHYIKGAPNIIVPWTEVKLSARVLHRFPDVEKEELRVGLKFDRAIHSYVLNKILYPDDNLQVLVRFWTLIVQGDNLGWRFLLAFRDILKEGKHQRIDLRGLNNIESWAITLLHEEMKRGVSVIGMNANIRNILEIWRDFDQRYPTPEAYAKAHAQFVQNFAKRPV